jgi:hypothetical protein
MNQKHFGIIAIIALTFTVLSLTGCPPEPEPTPTHVHQWGPWTTTTPATCAATGTQTRTCALDAAHIDTQDIPIDPTAHDWGNWVETTPATTTADGVETKTCKNDATHKETQPIAKLIPTCPCPAGTEHPYGTTCPPACEANGTPYCTCTTAQEQRGDKDPQSVGGFTFTSNTVTVRGVSLTETEWASVLTQLPQIVNERYAAAPEGGPVRSRYDEVFLRQSFVITVDQGADYENWKTDATGYALRLNINKLANWSSIMNAAIRAVQEPTATQARVMPGRDTLRMG